MFKPLNKYVLVERECDDRVSPGGIVIPDALAEKPNVGIVKAVREGSIVSVGEKVLFGKYSGHDVKHDGVDYLFILEEDIIAVIE